MDSRLKDPRTARAFRDEEDSEDDESLASSSSGPARFCCWPAAFAALVLVVCLTTAVALVFRHGGHLRSPAYAPGKQCGDFGRPAGPEPNMVVHFLDMVMDEVPHVEVWKEFFKGAPSGSAHMWVHCKSRDKCQAGLEAAGVTNFTVVPSVYNEWCTDLFSPMLQLLKYALAHRPIGSTAVEKFVFVSNQHLPIKPFSYIRAVLGEHPYSSDFCIYANKDAEIFNWPYATVGGADLSIVKASQWMVLARQDAEHLVTSLPSPVPEHPLSLPFADNMSLSDFVHDGHHACLDEVVAFTTIFGFLRQPEMTYPGVGPVTRSEPRVFSEQGCCRTLVYFGSPMLEMIPAARQQMNLTEEMLKDRRRAESSGTEIMDELMADLSFRASLAADVSKATLYIVPFQNLSARSMRTLRSSWFLFARKFGEEPVAPDFANIMFS